MRTSIFASVFAFLVFLLPTASADTLSKQASDQHAKLKSLVSSSYQASLLTGEPRGRTSSANSIRIGEHLFDPKPIHIDERDAKRILAIFSEEKYHHPHAPKFCGKFHPDFIAIYREGSSTLKIMVCLTCHE